MHLSVEGTDLQKVIEVAIVTALGEAGQKGLVEEVVRYLTQGRSGYSQKDSPLKEALHDAASRAANLYFEKHLAADPQVQAALADLYQKAVAQFCGPKTQEKMVADIAARIAKAFDRDY